MSVILDKVSKSYGTQKALDEISFTLEGGEICGFLGPNGAGKSTTMKIITGYLNDYQGEVTVNTISIRKNPLQAKKIIGYLPEQNPLYPDMYIREYLLHIARLYHIPEARKKVNDIIEQTGLQAEIRKKIGQLSKGYRQRVGLAQALVHDPEILILDEPMTGLDPNQLEEIRHLIKETGKNKTVLLSTHVMQEVEAICDRVIIINQGKIITDKPIQEVSMLPDEGMTLYIEFSPETSSEWLISTDLFSHITQKDPNCWQLTARPGEDPRKELFYLAATHHCPIIGLKTEEHNLETIFHKLTQK